MTHLTFAEARSKVLDIILEALHKSYEGTHFPVAFTDPALRQKLNAILIDLEVMGFIEIEEIIPSLDGVALFVTALKSLWQEDDSRRAFRSPLPSLSKPIVNDTYSI